MSIYGQAIQEATINQINIQRLRSIVDKIKKKVDKDRKPPTGNQNCMLCTWCMEAQIRGIDVLPRPVYSPRDIIFTTKGLNGYNIIKNPRIIRIKDKEDVKYKVLNSGFNSRYYAHVNWENSKGGHEFIVININGVFYIIDAQDGLLELIDSEKGSYYFDKINYTNSYIIRIDNKPFNRDILKYNDNSYILDWEDGDENYL